MPPRSLSSVGGENMEDDNQGYFFLSSHAAHQIGDYRYQGADLSLLYKYVLSPLADFLVKYATPRWIGPNLITMIGLLFMINSYVIMWYFCPSLQCDVNENIPAWVFLYNGIAILIYQTLDNMDGKQARRTGTASPLGLIFDHGCDAINSLFGSTGWIISMALNPKSDALLCWITLMGPYALFYIGTWEQYHTGKLVLPIVNGPNEGLLGAAIMSFASYAYGTSMWQSTSVYENLVAPLVGGAEQHSIGPLRNCDLLILAASAGFVQEIILKTFSVTRKYGFHALVSMAPFAVLVAASFSLMVWSNEHTWLVLPRTLLHLFATLFVDMVMDLMLAHTTNDHYTSRRWILAPLAVIAMGRTFSSWTPSSDTILLYTCFALVYVSLRTLYLLQEIASILNVWIFDIVTPRTSPAEKKHM